MLIIPLLYIIIIYIYYDYYIIIIIITIVTLPIIVFVRVTRENVPFRNDEKRLLQYTYSTYQQQQYYSCCTYT